MSRQQQVAVHLVAITGMVLASACDSADVLSAPRTAAPSHTMPPSFDTAPATGPGPMMSAVAADVCADVWGASTAPGAAVLAYACHGGANQKFALQASGAITAYDGALCLDVAGGVAKDGDAVITWTCHGGTNQKWTRTAAGELQTAVNGKCLDVPAGRVGTKLIVYTCNGGTNQRWTLPSATAITPAQVTPPVAAPAAPVAVEAMAAASAELPRVLLDTHMPAPTGRTINVTVGQDLQAALDAALPGDVVSLAPGAAFVGNYVLRAKPNMSGKWITVRSAGALPAEGARTTAADAAQMAKLLTPNAVSALSTEPGAQGWRLTGLEVSATEQAPMVYALVSFGAVGADQRAAAQVPSRLVLDRSYVHGLPRLNIQRCVTLNSASTAIIDSYLAECHGNNGDAQAVVGWNGPGPFKLVNNRLEGGSQGIMFGGSDPTVPGLIPSDIEIRRNYVTRPTSWRGVWHDKNLLEVKAGQRLLVEGNVFENNWVDAQNGFAFVWWSANADGGALWSVTQDITFRYNVVRNVAAGFNLADRYNASLPRMSRVTIVHNIITGLDASNGRLYQVSGTVSGLTIANNSGLGVNSDVMFATPEQPLSDFVFRNNVTGGQYTLFAVGTGMGAASLRALQVPAANVSGNVFAGGSGAGAVPAGNAYAPSAAAIGFADFAGGDLRLSAASAYRTGGTGGSAPGADVDAVTQYTAGVRR